MKTFSTLLIFWLLPVVSARFDIPFEDYVQVAMSRDRVLVGNMFNGDIHQLGIETGQITKVTNLNRVYHIAHVQNDLFCILSQKGLYVLPAGREIPTLIHPLTNAVFLASEGGDIFLRRDHQGHAAVLRIDLIRNWIEWTALLNANHKEFLCSSKDHLFFLKKNLDGTGNIELSNYSAKDGRLLWSQTYAFSQFSPPQARPGQSCVAEDKLLLFSAGAIHPFEADTGLPRPMIKLPNAVLAGFLPVEKTGAYVMACKPGNMNDLYIYNDDRVEKVAEHNICLPSMRMLSDKILCSTTRRHTGCFNPSEARFDWIMEKTFKAADNGRLVVTSMDREAVIFFTSDLHEPAPKEFLRIPFDELWPK